MTQPYPDLARLPHTELQALVHELGSIAAYCAHHLLPCPRADVYNRGPPAVRLVLAHYRAQLTPEDEREADPDQRNRSPGQ